MRSVVGRGWEAGMTGDVGGESDEISRAARDGGSMARAGACEWPWGASAKARDIQDKTKSALMIHEGHGRLLLGRKG